MARIAQILEVPSTGLGGMERMAALIARALTMAGHEVVEYTSQTLPPVRVFRRWPGLNRPLEVLKTARAYAGVLRKCEAVIGHGMYGAFISHPRRAYIHHNTFAAVACIVRPFVDTPSYLIARYVYGWLDRQAGRGATRVAVSRSVALEAEKHYRQTAHRIIHNAVDSAHFRPHDRATARARLGLPDDLWIGAVVGRVSIGKGVQTVNRLLPRLPDGAVLAFAAPKVSPRLRLVDGRAILLGSVPREQMPLLYSACDALVFPSLYESFGLVTTEALACGLPVITSCVGIVPEMLGHEPTFDSMVVNDPHDAEAFRDRIIQLMDDPSLGRCQAAWGQAYVREHFSLDRFNRAYCALMEEMLAA